MSTTEDDSDEKKGTESQLHGRQKKRGKKRSENIRRKINWLKESQRILMRLLLAHNSVNPVNPIPSSL